MSPVQLDPRLDVVELTRAICDIDSVSGNETELADAIESALRTCEHLTITRDGDAVIARTLLGRANRVVVAGHIDTVPVNNNLPSQLSGADLVGRGSVDMKGGVAVALKLACEMTNPRHDVTWIFYDHEEVAANLNGLGRVARNHPELLAADFAILGEPSNGSVEGGCNGTLRAVLTTSGTRAHSARAWMGDNAIHKLGPALRVLSEYQAKTVTVDGLDYRESLSAVGIAGGVAGNVIPDAASLTVNYRFAPDKTVEQALAHLHEVFDGYELVLDDSAPGARPGLTAELALEFVALVGREPTAKLGWTDVARFSEFGIPAINFGPGDPSLAHADDERVPVAQISECARILRAWLS
jgi:succinyl-diaminopimelate desuccinylase